MDKNFPRCENITELCAFAPIPVLTARVLYIDHKDWGFHLTGNTRSHTTISIKDSGNKDTGNSSDSQKIKN